LIIRFSKEKNMSRINLGDHVRDRMTGIEGIAFGRSTYLTGCDHIGIKRPGTGSDGKAFDMHWVDEPLIEMVKQNAFLVSAEVATKPGGPSLHMPSRT
jgi:hypothetical protein